MLIRRIHPLEMLVACLLLAGMTTACSAQRPNTNLMMASVDTHDAIIATAFRVLLDDVIGDSADKVCLSVARTADDGSLIDADPSNAVMQTLRGTSAAALPRSACAADERNFGNPHGLLRLRDVSAIDEHTLIVHAEAIGDHSARYECILPRGPRTRHAQCRITARDWPGSQRRG